MQSAFQAGVGTSIPENRPLWEGGFFLVKCADTEFWSEGNDRVEDYLFMMCFSSQKLLLRVLFDLFMSHFCFIFTWSAHSWFSNRLSSGMVKSWVLKRCWKAVEVGEKWRSWLRSHLKHISQLYISILSFSFILPNHEIEHKKCIGSLNVSSAAPPKN